MDYNRKQLMAIALSKEVEDGKTYIVGTGLPLIGASLAKKTHAPNAKLLFETGILDSDIQELPNAVADLRLTYGASMFWPQYRYYGYQILASRNSDIDAGFLGGAQIDPYGNLNSTSIGDYHNPETRFSGSGGANGIATFCNTIIVMKLETRRFVEHVDYCTSPGWIDGPDGRKNRGLNPNIGPRAVITDYGVFRFGDDKRMYLSEIFPGITKADILNNIGFDVDVSKAKDFGEPAEGILRVLSEKVDPGHLMT